MIAVSPGHAARGGFKERAAQPQLVPDAIPRRQAASVLIHPSLLQTKVRSVTVALERRSSLLMGYLSRESSSSDSVRVRHVQPSPPLTRRPTSYRSQLPLGQHPQSRSWRHTANLYEFINAFSNGAAMGRHVLRCIQRVPCRQPEWGQPTPTAGHHRLTDAAAEGA